MTWTNLKTNYKNIDWDGLRKYQMIDNQDGTVSFLDVTEYINAEDANVLANGLNQNNDAVNRIMNGEYFYFEGEVDTLLGAKQNLLTFDNAPTSGSANPVKSGGIKTALDTISSRIDNLTVFSIYVCGNGEYNPTTGQPTIQNPDTSTFYLVPSSGSAPDIFTEWIYVNNAWELFGSGKVDLSNYVTQSDLQTALAGKEDTLTFDSSATSGSANPVTSDGIYNGLSGKSNIGHDHDDRYYTETETDTLLAGKSSTGHEHDDRYYTESEMDTLLGGKRDVSDSYTKNEVDTLLSAKVDNTSLGGMAFVGDTSSDNKAYGRKDGSWYDLDGRYYTESEVDTLLGAKADTSSLGAMAFEGDSSSDGKAYARKDGGWYDLDGRYYTESEVDSALANKANLTIIAPSFSTSTAYVVGDYVVYQGGLYCFTSAHSAGAWNSSHVSAVNVGDELEDRVKRSGDTMSGDLTISKNHSSRFIAQATNITEGTAPTSTTELGLFGVKDNSGNILGYSAFTYLPNKVTRATLLSRHHKNGSYVTNRLDLTTDYNGNREVNVNGAEQEWRDAIGAVNKAGDTMTGGLDIDGAFLQVKTPSIDRTTAPANHIYGNGIRFLGANDQSLGYFRPQQTTANRLSFDFASYRRTANNTDVYNQLSLGILEDGTRTITVTEIKPWRVMMKNVLYYYDQAVSAANEGTILRIPASGTDSSITTDTVVLECYFVQPLYVRGKVGWQSYAGYILFTGTSTNATRAHVVLGNIANGE